MKKFHELTEEQQAKAVEYSLSEVVQALVDGYLHIRFVKGLNNAIFETMMVSGRDTLQRSPEVVYEMVLKSDSLIEELLPIAQGAAEMAIYSEPLDHVIRDIA